MTTSPPAATNEGRVPGRKAVGRYRRATRRPLPPARVRGIYEDEDSFDIPDIALGAAKE